MWKNNDFAYVEKTAGYILGYERRFYQNSIDHRGTETNPGRVATLVKSKDNEVKVLGIGYKIANEKKNEVITHLDFREKNGYSRHVTLFYPSDGVSPKLTTVYVANEDNPSWNNDHKIESIAKQIFSAVGPSGRNIAYVFELADALRMYFNNPQDDHLFEIENILKEMQSKSDSAHKS